MSLLNEDKNHKFEYGCVMLYFTFPEMKYLHKMVNPEDIYTEEDDSSFGLEDEPHTTLLFGLHDTVSLDDVKDVMDEFKDIYKLFSPRIVIKKEKKYIQIENYSLCL